MNLLLLIHLILWTFSKWSNALPMRSLDEGEWAVLNNNIDEASNSLEPEEPIKYMVAEYESDIPNDIYVIQDLEKTGQWEEEEINKTSTELLVKFSSTFTIVPKEIAKNTNISDGPEIVLQELTISAIPENVPKETETFISLEHVNEDATTMPLDIPRVTKALNTTANGDKNSTQNESTSEDRAFLKNAANPENSLQETEISVKLEPIEKDATTTTPDIPTDTNTFNTTVNEDMNTTKDQTFWENATQEVETSLQLEPVDKNTTTAPNIPADTKTSSTTTNMDKNPTQNKPATKRQGFWENIQSFFHNNLNVSKIIKIEFDPLQPITETFEDIKKCNLWKRINSYARKSYSFIMRYSKKSKHLIQDNFKELEETLGSKFKEIKDALQTKINQNNWNSK